MPLEQWKLQDDGRRALLDAMITEDPHRLRRRSLSLGVSSNDADDVAQTALLKAWRSIERLQTPEPGHMCSWLDTIARNTATDLARQHSRRPASGLDHDVAGSQNTSGEVEMRLFLDGALQAIRELPDTLREPLVLSVAEGLSAKDIAKRLEITPAAVRQRISRARKALDLCRASGMFDTL